MIEKIKQKVTELLDKAELHRFMTILHFIFNRSDDQRIRRTSKSLITLLNSETCDSIEEEKEIKM